MWTDATVSQKPLAIIGYEAKNSINSLMVGPAAMALGQFMVNGLFTLLTAELEGRAYYSSSDAQLHHGQA